MANKTMHHAVIGADTFELIDEAGREETSQLKNALIVNNASGAIASFPDGGDGFAVRDLSVQLEPIQDLHGYDNPWPEGGGKNKFICFDTTLTTAGLTIEMKGHSVKITGTASVDTSVNLNFGGSGNNVGAVLKNGSAHTWSAKTEGTIPNGISIYGGYLGSSVSQTSLFHPDGYASTTIPSEGTYQDRVWIAVHAGEVYNGTLYIQTEEGSSKTSYAPYSNICPISGRESVTVTRTGKNLLEPKFYDGFQYSPNVGSSVVLQSGIVDITDSVTKTGDTYTKSGASWSVPMNMIFYVNRQFWGKTVKFSGTIDHINGFRSEYYVVDSNDILLAKSASMNEDPTWTITIPENTSYIVWFLNTFSAGTMKLTNPMIELGSTATAFEPYNGQQVTIQLGQTVYGGTLDVTSGTLTVTDGYVNLVGGSEASYSNNGHTDNTTRGIVTVSGKAYGLENMISDKFATSIAPDKVGSMSGRNANSGIEFYLPPTVPNTTEGIVDWFSNNNTQLCYELATPVTVQLTAQQMTTLLGQNNVWSDADSVSVDYVADTKLYIEQLTEPDADMVADMNITSGKYFMVGNSLYLATANIANGAAIVVGVNCTRTNLAEALNAINA